MKKHWQSKLNVGSSDSEWGKEIASALCAALFFALVVFSICICISIPITQPALNHRGSNISRRIYQSVIFWNLCVCFPVPLPLGREYCNVDISHRFNLQLSTLHTSWLNNAFYDACLLFLYHSSFLLLVLFTQLALKVFSYIMLLK